MSIDFLAYDVFEITQNNIGYGVVLNYRLLCTWNKETDIILSRTIFCNSALAAPTCSSDAELHTDRMWFNVLDFPSGILDCGENSVTWFHTVTYRGTAL